MRVSVHHRFILTIVCCAFSLAGYAMADIRVVPDQYSTIKAALVQATPSTVIKVRHTHVETDLLEIKTSGVTIEGITPYTPLKRRSSRPNAPLLRKRGGRPINISSSLPTFVRLARKAPLEKVKAAPTWMPQILPAEEHADGKNPTIVSIWAEGVKFRNFVVGEYGTRRGQNGVHVYAKDVELTNVHCLGPFSRADGANQGNGIGTTIEGNGYDSRGLKVKECSVVNAELNGIELRGRDCTVTDCWVMCDDPDQQHPRGTDYYFLVWDKDIDRPGSGHPVSELRDSNCTFINCVASRLPSPDGLWPAHHGHGFTIQGVDYGGDLENLSVGKNNKIIDCDAYDVSDSVLLRGLQCCGNEVRNFLSVVGNDAGHNDGRDGLIMIEGGAHGNFIRGYRGINNSVAIEFTNRKEAPQDIVGSNNVFYECTWTDIRSRAIDHNYRNNKDGEKGRVTSTFIASSTFSAKRGQTYIPFFFQADRIGEGNTMMYCDISGFGKMARFVDENHLPSPTNPAFLDLIGWGLFNNNIDGEVVTSGWREEDPSDTE